MYRVLLTAHTHTHTHTHTLSLTHPHRLNTVREVCVRCPLVMDEDLLRDLTAYKSYKDKGVMMASRSLIQLFRNIQPDMLHRKDRVRVCVCGSVFG